MRIDQFDVIKTFSFTLVFRTSHGQKGDKLSVRSEYWHTHPFMAKSVVIRCFIFYVNVKTLQDSIEKDRSGV